MSDVSSLLDRLPEDAVWRVEGCCSRFEAEWLAGRRPSIEGAVSGLAGDERRAVLREVVRLDVHYRNRTAESPRLEDYTARFPDDEDLLVGLFGQETSTLTESTTGQTQVYQSGGDPTLPPPGDLSSRFARLRFHAAGNLGEVYVARDTELHRDVALKELQPRHAHWPDRQARFLLEGEVTGRLEHPGVVPVYGLGRHPDGRPYYAMRLIRGETLEAAAARFHALPSKDFDGLEFRQLLGRFVSVCQTIAYAHDRGVLHRDLKPANIMLGRFGEALVVDWGLARVGGGAAEAEDDYLRPSGPSASATTTGTVLGTPAFMSPEQAAGHVNEIGPASDVYGLGATLYVLLTGQPAFSGTVAEVLDRVRTGRWESARRLESAVPFALDAVCARAMALKPTDRYPTALALAEDLEHWLADDPVSACSEPVAARARRWVRKHPRSATGGAVVLIAAVIGLAAGAALLDRSKREAEANFRITSEAARTLLGRVNEEHLLHEPGMRPLRQRLLVEALEYYTKFLAKRPDDPTVRAERASATRQLGELYAESGRTDHAIPLIRAAVEEFTDLVRARPADREPRIGLALAFLAAADLHTKIGDSEEAHIDASRAVAELDGLRSVTPDDPHLLQLLGRALDARATAGASRGGFDQAIEDNARAGSVLYYAVLVEFSEARGRSYITPFHPGENAEPRGQFGTSYLLFRAWLNQGRLQHMVGRTAAAVPSLSTAIATVRQLQQLYPHLQRYNPRTARLRLGLAEAQLHAGRVALDLGHVTVSVRHLDEATGLARTATEDPVDDVGGEPRRLLAVCLASAGEARLRLGQYARAASLLTEAENRFRDLTGDGSDATLQAGYSRALATHGRLEADRGNTGRGLALCEQALAVLDPLVTSRVWDRGLRAEQLRIRQLEARLRHQTGRDGRAEYVEKLRQLLADQRSLASTEPLLPTFQREIGAAAAVLSEALTTGGDSLQAMSVLDDAMPVHERLVDADELGYRLRQPASGPTRQDPLRNNPRGEVLQIDRAGLARDFWSRDPAREPEDWRMRQIWADLLAARATALIALDRKAEARVVADRAVAVANRLVSGPAIEFGLPTPAVGVWPVVSQIVARQEPGYRYDLACHQTLSAVAHGMAPDAAVTTIRELIATGFDCPAVLLANRRLAPLHMRADFKAALQIPSTDGSR